MKQSLSNLALRKQKFVWVPQTRSQVMKLIRGRARAPPRKHKEQQNIKQPAGLGWARVNFLHSNWDGTTFWICAENRVDYTGMF